jgi:serine/threonine-protein kinase/endoribonuclease IRE1
MSKMPNGLPGPLRLTTFFLLAFAAAQQQQSRKDGSRSSPPENAALRPLTKPDPLQPPNVDSPTYKNGKYTSSISDDERAVATLAPAGLRPAVRAPPASRSAAGSSAGLAQPLHARKLQDWEVENFVLMATVDGSIYARDRNTGKELWKFFSEDPMVQTKYNRDPASNHDGEDTNDDFMWIVEPSDGGSLYAFMPGPDTGIQKLPMTVRQLADFLSPYTSEDSSFVYNAEKRTNLFTLNATNGAALKYFGVGGGGVMDKQNCRKVSGLEPDEDEDECEPTPTLQLGRTEYTVNIQDFKTLQNVCTIKYFEWTPNKRDGDLADKYFTTMDNKYIYSRYDGSIIALEHHTDDKTHPLPLYQKKFTSSPVVRVFDVVKPQGTDSRDTPLVILPQPIAPVVLGERTENVFINCTETGSWYAMSELSYPSVTDGASEAKCYQQKAGFLNDKTFLSEQKLIKASELVGVHVLSDSREPRHNVPSIDAPELLLPERKDSEPSLQLSNKTSDHFVSSTFDSTSNMRAWLNSLFTPYNLLALTAFLFLWWQQSQLKQAIRKPTQGIESVEPVLAAPQTPLTEVVVGREQAVPQEPEAPAERRVHFAPIQEDEPVVDLVNDTAQAEPVVVPVVPIQAHLGQGPLEPVAEEPEETDTPKKKKAHRGSRGGRKNKKNKKTEDDDMDEDIARIVDSVVPHKQTMQPDPEPTIDGAVNDVSEARHISSITVNNDKILGFGSGGTVVYEGTFEVRGTDVWAGT